MKSDVFGISIKTLIICLVTAAAVFFAGSEFGLNIASKNVNPNMIEVKTHQYGDLAISIADKDAGFQILDGKTKRLEIYPDDVGLAIFNLYSTKLNHLQKKLETTK